MKRTFLAAVWAALAASLALAADIAPAVEKAERDFVAAVTKADTATLGKYLAQDLMYTHSSGARDTKESYLDKVGKGVLKYESWEIEKIEVRPVSDNVAAVAALAKVRVVSGGKPNEMKLSILHVFAKRQGRWQLVAHQSAKLP